MFNFEDELVFYSCMGFCLGIGFMGIKFGCGEGGCGVCIVMLLYYDISIGFIV